MWCAFSCFVYFYLHIFLFSGCCEMCFLTSHERSVDKASVASGGLGVRHGPESPYQQRQLPCKWKESIATLT